MKSSIFTPCPIYRRFTNFAIEYPDKNKNHDKMVKIGIDTINTSLGEQHQITKELSIPNNVVSPFAIKPTIISYGS